MPWSLLGILLAVCAVMCAVGFYKFVYFLSIGYGFAIAGGGNLRSNFYEVDLPESISKVYGYRLFYFTSPEDTAKARQLTERALELYYLGKRNAAQKMIRRAYVMAPGQGKIYEAFTIICRRPPPALKPPRKAN